MRISEAGTINRYVEYLELVNAESGQTILKSMGELGGA
jgi:hypothetical protein